MTCAWGSKQEKRRAVLWSFPLPVSQWSVARIQNENIHNSSWEKPAAECGLGCSRCPPGSVNWLSLHRTTCLDQLFSFLCCIIIWTHTWDAVASCPALPRPSHFFPLAMLLPVSSGYTAEFLLSQLLPRSFPLTCCRHFLHYSLCIGKLVGKFWKQMPVASPIPEQLNLSLWWLWRCSWIE